MDQELPKNEDQEWQFLGKKPMQYSQAYRKFFEDWEEHAVQVAPGKFRTERIYVGDYYSLKGGLTRKLGMAAAYLVLLASMLLCFFRASTYDITYNTTWYSAVTQTLIMLSSIWVLVAFVSWLFSPAKMTIGELRSGPKLLLKSSLAGVTANGLAAVACLLQVLIHPEQDVKELLVCCCLYLAGGAILWLLRFLEKSNVYVQIVQK